MAAKQPPENRTFVMLFRKIKQHTRETNDGEPPRRTRTSQEQVMCGEPAGDLNLAS